MPSVKVLDMTGKEVSDYELSALVFGVTPNKTAMHTMVVSYLANQRQGTQSTLTRTEVRGGGRKPWRRVRGVPVKAIKNHPYWLAEVQSLVQNPETFPIPCPKKQKDKQ